MEAKFIGNDGTVFKVVKAGNAIQVRVFDDDGKIGDMIVRENGVIQGIEWGTELVAWKKPPLTHADLPDGTQIAYIPMHADGDINHSDVEFGFVCDKDRKLPDSVLCRYWHKGGEGSALRTVANGERTPFEMLVVHRSTYQGTIDRLVEEIQRPVTLQEA